MTLDYHTSSQKRKFFGVIVSAPGIFHSLPGPRAERPRLNLLRALATKISLTRVGSMCSAALPQSKLYNKWVKCKFKRESILGTVVTVLLFATKSSHQLYFVYSLANSDSLSFTYFSTFCSSAKMANYGSLNKSQQGLNANHPYAAGDPYYAESTGFITPQQAVKKRGMSNWIKFGVPLLIVVVVAAVLGGVLGSRKSNNDAATSTSGNSSDSGTHGSGAALDLSDSRFATATDSKYLEPLYPSIVCTYFL